MSAILLWLFLSVLVAFVAVALLIQYACWRRTYRIEDLPELSESRRQK